MTTWADVPPDTQRLVLSKLDIDSRRAIGLYTKLRVPSALADELTRVTVRLLPKSSDWKGMQSQSGALLWLRMPRGGGAVYRKNLKDDIKASKAAPRLRALRIARAWVMAHGDGESVELRVGVTDGGATYLFSRPMPENDEYPEESVMLGLQTWPWWFGSRFDEVCDLADLNEMPGMAGFAV